VVKAIFSSSRSYDLQLATIQAVILLAFNPISSPASASASPVELSYEALKTFSNLPDEACKRVLHSFVKMKLLKKISPSPTPTPSINTTDIFSVNQSFRCTISFFLPLLLLSLCPDPQLPLATAARVDSSVSLSPE
jgi:hypothetical protein